MIGTIITQLFDRIKKTKQYQFALHQEVKYILKKDYILETLQSERYLLQAHRVFDIDNTNEVANVTYLFSTME